MEIVATYLSEDVKLVSVMGPDQRHHYRIDGGEHDGATFDSMTEYFKFAVAHGLRLPGNEQGWRDPRSKPQAQ